MKVITSNPVITGTLKSFEDDFVSDKSGFNGMTIKTTDPIIDGSLKTFEDGFVSNDSGFNGITIKATNPTHKIIDGSLKSFEEDFASNNSGFNGLTVISENPVLTNAEYIEDDWLSSVSGATRRARRESRRGSRANKRASGDTLINKVGKGLNRIADSGIVDSLRNLRNPQQDIVADDLPYITHVPAPTPDKSMSTGVKVAIGIGVAAIIGGGIYNFMKKK